MPHIVHRTGIEGSSPEPTYQALSTAKGLASRWTETAVGESRVGGVLQFRSRSDNGRAKPERHAEDLQAVPGIRLGR